MNKAFRLFLLALSLALVPAVASAAVLGTYTHDYGKKKYIPQGSNRVAGNGVQVSQTATDPFFDSFDFSDLAGSTIGSIALTLEFGGAGLQTLGALAPEAWDVSMGSASGPTSGTIVGRLDDDLSPQTFTLDASFDVGTSTPFADALASTSIGFWFDQNGLLPAQQFNLRSATLTVSAAVVPLPAPFFLLATGLLGLGLVQRRQRRRAYACSPLS